jgi:hypothetical protein
LNLQYIRKDRNAPETDTKSQETPTSMGPRSPLLTSWFMFMFPPCQNALYQDRKERRTSNNCGRYTNQLHIANRKFDISVKETSTQTQRSVALRGRPEEEIRLINHNQEENHRGTFPGFRIPSSRKLSQPLSPPDIWDWENKGKWRVLACAVVRGHLLKSFEPRYQAFGRRVSEMASTRMRLFLTVAGRPISEILETRYSCSCRVSCECENPRWRINVNGKEGGVGVGRQAVSVQPLLEGWEPHFNNKVMPTLRRGIRSIHMLRK